MKTDLIQLAYSSTRASDLTDDDVVDGIVLPSMTRNRGIGITGCIWFNRTSFFQVLEGVATSVQALYDIIAKDDRHADVRLLRLAPIDRRHFDRYCMRTPRRDEEIQLDAVLSPNPKRADVPEEGVILRAIADLSRAPDVM